MIKQDTLYILRDIYQTMVEHAQSKSPIESCGYLSGIDDRIEIFYPMENIDHSADHFSFDPVEQFRVVKEVRGHGHKILAVYHSHPVSPARLSAEDVRLFNDPDPVYLILSLMDKEPDLKGFRVTKPSDEEVNIEQVKLVITKRSE